MKCLVAFLLLASGYASAAPVLVHHAKNATGTTLTVALSSTSTGNCLTLAAESNQSGTNRSISSISNTGGATWTRRAIVVNNNSQQQTMELWSGSGNTGTGSDVITVVLNAGAAYEAIYAQEWSGINCTPSGGPASAASGTQTTTISSGNFSAAVGGLVFGIAGVFGSAAAVGSGFTPIDTDGFSISEYQIAVGTTVAVTASGTNGWLAAAGISFSLPSTFVANQSVIAIQ